MKRGTKRKGVSESSPDGAKKRVSRSTRSAKEATVPDHVWVLTTKTGYHPDGFHSATEPEFKVRGVFLDTASNLKLAKDEAERLVGAPCGLDFDEVEEGGELEVTEEDDLIEYDWAPPDSEFSVVTLQRQPLNTIFAGLEK